MWSLRGYSRTLLMTYSKADRHLIWGHILPISYGLQYNAYMSFCMLHILIMVYEWHFLFCMLQYFLKLKWSIQVRSCINYLFGISVVTYISISVNSQDQLQDDLTKIARARDEMARAIGSIDTFIYGSLREKPAIGARSGTSKPEQIKEWFKLIIK